MVHNAPGESVEWVNMCFRKIWRVYQRGLERWITDLLQPVFDALINVSGSSAPAAAKVTAAAAAVCAGAPAVEEAVAVQCGGVGMWASL
jgi:hypothetical protein